MVCVTRTGLDKAWAGARALLRKLFESRDRSRGGGGRSKRSGGGRSGNGSYHYHNHANGAGRRWRPGRRVVAAAFLTLLAVIRRYQVR